MKKTKTKCINKIINNNLYGVENTPDFKYLTEDEIKENKQGYVLLPYILGEPTEESSRQYDDFMKEYHKQHKYCPKCGGEHHKITLVNYVLNLDKKEKYKDMNICECNSCGNIHSKHDRVSSIEQKKIKKYKYTISTRGYYRQDFIEDFDLYSDDYYSPESFQNIVSKTFAEVYVNEYADYSHCDSGNLIFEVLRILKEKYRFTSDDDRFVASYRLKSDININAIDDYINNELDGDESELDNDAILFFKHLNELQNKTK